MSAAADDVVKMNAAGVRQAEHQAHAQFLNRWSPRAMSGESIPREELMQLFEAARWAPSSYNAQPWRFLFAERTSPDWQKFLGLLIEFNQTWCAGAAALVVIVSRTTFEMNGKPSVTHSFDTGAAWGYLALQGSLQGLVVHGMQGFDYDRARSELNVPADHEVMAMCAIGKPGRISELPPKIQEREVPSGRKTLKEIVCEGSFHFPGAAK